MIARTSNGNTFEGYFAVGTTKKQAHTYNYKGFDLLTDWEDLRFERCEKIARRGLKKLSLFFTHGGQGISLDDIFGLPYTSSSSFAAIWVTNCEAYTMRNGKRHFLDGIALDGSLRPVALYTVRDENGNEVEGVAEEIE